MYAGLFFILLDHKIIRTSHLFAKRDPTRNPSLLDVCFQIFITAWAKEGHPSELDSNAWVYCIRNKLPQPRRDFK